MARKQPIDATTRQRARELRGTMTRYERMLWARLRCRQLCGLRFRRQHPIAPYIVDFCCLEHHLVIELDGNQHAEDAQIAHDDARARVLSECGYRVLRFSNWEVARELDGVLRTIAVACDVDLDEPAAEYRG